MAETQFTDDLVTSWTPEDHARFDWTAESKRIAEMAHQASIEEEERMVHVTSETDPKIIFCWRSDNLPGDLVASRITQNGNLEAWFDWDHELCVFERIGTVGNLQGGQYAYVDGVLYRLKETA